MGDCGAVIQVRTTKATWVKFGTELLELDAVYSLAGSTGMSQVEAAGYIALVVAFAIANADDEGVIDHMTDKAIETACYWTGERGTLVAAFLDAGVFDGERDSDVKPLCIEAGLWRSIAGKTIEERKAARKRKQKERATHKS